MVKDDINIRIVKYLRRFGEQKVSRIAEVVRARSDTVSSRLKTLVGQGKIVKVGDGVYRVEEV